MKMPKGLVLLSAVWLSACADGDVGTSTGTTDPDAIAGEVGLKSDGAAAETAALDATQTDAQVAEVAAEIQQPDAAPEIAPPPDTAAEVAPPPDVVAEVAPPPDTAGDPCADKLATFNKLQASSLACDKFWQCHKPATASASCPDCQNYHNAMSADTQNLIDYTPEFKKSGCGGVCSGACMDMVKNVGVCTASKCETKELSCKELDAAAGQALAEGAKCSTDKDCTFKVSNTLGCGCPTFVNITTMGPAKPLFNYMIMLVKAYKAKACTSDTTCACADPNSAKCVSGVCIAQ